MTLPYLARLGARIGARGTHLCLGIDPDPAALPRGFPADLEGIERFCRVMLGAAGEFAAAVKFNLAFFEAYGSRGIAVLERIRAGVPGDLPVILDGKRGDVPSTALRHAAALYDALGADAVTASPFLGEDAVVPLLDRTDRYVYLLCRTSNPGAAELQDLLVRDPGAAGPGEPLYARVARQAAVWASRRPRLGLVVGATAPDELGAVRSMCPELPFLVPGLGAQGGAVDAALRSGPASAGAAGALPGGALLVNVSRDIARAAGRADDPERAVHEAAAGWSHRVGVLR